MPKPKHQGINLAPAATLTLKPFWTTLDQELVRLYQGDVRDVLSRLPEKTVQCVVTSPPYWGLRDYGVEGQLGSEPSPDCMSQGQAQCGRCFVCNMVAVFRGVWRVLRDDGTLWLNLGDSYAGGGTGRRDTSGKYAERRATEYGSGMGDGNGPRDYQQRPPIRGLKSGNLVGVPWRVALALQADGWVLRQDIVWAKPSPMPESVRNRCTKAHEYIFLLTKGMGYYYDAEAIKEKASGAEQDGRDVTTPTSSNKRSVWHCSSQGYEGAHFATFPPKLITPCILAGTSEKGACARCGTPWRRVVAEKTIFRERPNAHVKYVDNRSTTNGQPDQRKAGVETRTVGWEPGCECFGRFVKRKVKIVGQKITGQKNVPNGWDVGHHSHDIMKHNSGDTKRTKEEIRKRATGIADAVREAVVEEYQSNLPLEDHPMVPCLVLDPFVGSGTTCVVSLKNGRRSWGVDLSEKYLNNNAIPRIEGALLEVPALAHQTGRLPKRTGGGERLL